MSNRQPTTSATASYDKGYERTRVIGTVSLDTAGVSATGYIDMTYPCVDKFEAALTLDVQSGPVAGRRRCRLTH